MENKEWLDDYMSLKQVNQANPFTVPDGYFDDLSDHITSYKNLNELSHANADPGFTVPLNYFENLTVNIQSRIAIEEAVNLTANGFSVPEGYFEALAENIQSRIAVEEAFAGGEGFSIPEGYFEELNQQIQGRIFIEQALGEPIEAFNVPQNYFEKLNKNILDKTANAENTRNRGIIRKLVTSTAFKYATAACVALALGSGILISQLSDSNTHQNTFLHKQLSKVPVDDIKNYLQLNVDAGDAQQTVTTQGAPDNMNEKELKDALQNQIDSVQ